jgi:hypothetical protein
LLSFFAASSSRLGIKGLLLYFGNSKCKMPGKKQQDFSNHTHWVPLYHYLTFAAMAILLAGASYNLIAGKKSESLFNTLFLLLVLTLVSVSFHNRSFALKAQDRAIRAEENLRYFILTGKRLDQRITMKQLIALRFADDKEFVELVDKTLKENLPPREIKKAIKDWRPDYYRA